MAAILMNEQAKVGFSNVQAAGTALLLESLTGYLAVFRARSPTGGEHPTSTLLRESIIIPGLCRRMSVFRAQPDRVSTLPEILGSVATRVSSPRPGRVACRGGATTTLEPTFAVKRALL
jgi:hypothetical protein